MTGYSQSRALWVGSAQRVGGITTKEGIVLWVLAGISIALVLGLFVALSLWPLLGSSQKDGDRQS